MFPDIGGFRPVNSHYNAPIPVPHTDPDASPGSSLSLSCEWWSYLCGALSHLLDDGVWDSNDQAEVTLASHRVEQLRWMIAHAADQGDCHTEALSCVYDFTTSQANPWIAGDTDTITQTTWSVIGLGWVGGQDNFDFPAWSEVLIEADFIPFSLNAFQAFYNSAHVPRGGFSWGIRFFDHGLNLLAEVTDTGADNVSFAGPLLNVCRIQVHCYQDSFAGTLTPAITRIEMTGVGVAGGCEQLIPLANPPQSHYCYDFSTGRNGWTEHNHASSSVFYIADTGFEGQDAFSVNENVFSVCHRADIAGATVHQVTVDCAVVGASAGSVMYVAITWNDDNGSTSFAQVGPFAIGARQTIVVDVNAAITDLYIRCQSSHTGAVGDGNAWIYGAQLSFIGTSPLGAPNC